MQLLYITNKPVYPLLDGGCKAMQSLLNILISLDIPLTHFCVSTYKHPFEREKYPTEINFKTPIQAFHTNTKPNVIRFIKEFFTGESYNINRFFNTELKQAIDDFEENESLVVILESVYLASYIEPLKKRKNTRVILRTHNIEHDLWFQKSSETSNPLKKIIFNYLAKRLKKSEIYAFLKVDELFAISESDANSIRKFCPTKKVSVIPLTFEIQINNCDYS